MAKEAVAFGRACMHARPVAAGDIATIVSPKGEVSQDAERLCSGRSNNKLSRLDWSQPGRLTSRHAIIQCGDY